MKNVHELLELLELEQIEMNLFRGKSTMVGGKRVYGGQVLAQALHAAARTAPEDRRLHSLHGYFILPGSIEKPIIYEVDRIRDGGSFTTRRVVAIQNGKAIFNSSASFQAVEEGFDHQGEAPDVPDPEELLDDLKLAERFQDKWPLAFRTFFERDRPIEFRPVDQYDAFNPGKQAPVKYVWLRAKGDMQNAPAASHQHVLAYAADYNLLTTALNPHWDHVSFANLQLASLDHAMWFHRDFRIDEWLLYAIDSPSASNGRGFTRGNIFTRDGKLVASVVQEGLVRKRR